MNRFRIICLASLVVFCFGIFTACGEDPLAKGKTTINFWAEITLANASTVENIVDEFNRTNQDNVYVRLTKRSAGYSKDISNQLKSANPQCDVVLVDDRYFKGYVINEYLEPLGAYLNESGSAPDALNLDQMYPSLVNRFRYDAKSGVSGGDTELYALPNGGFPTLIYYNEDLFAAQKVHVISISEEELSDYNEKHGTAYLPHGYYAYSTAPKEGILPRGDGKYHVFNNQIPMNWEELVACAKIFTKSYHNNTTSKYGFMNEWWFSHGWSVGGDCLEWSDEKNQYVFALGEKIPNYLVTGTEPVVVNGTSYRETQLLSYSDKHYVESVLNKEISDEAIDRYIEADRLYEMPSIYDAFLEFCRLSQTTDKEVAKGVKGYGISPNPSIINQTGKNPYFTGGEVAMLANGVTEMYTIGKNMSALGRNWNIAPLNQYREYNPDGSVKTVNDTPVFGKKAAHSTVSGLAIARNGSTIKKAASWKFIKFMADEKAQAMMMKANYGMPNQIALCESEEYLSQRDNYAPENKQVLTDAAGYCTVGDWSYVEDGEWIGPWADVLNTKVRNGAMTLDEFFQYPPVLKTDEILKRYQSKKFNG